MAISNDIDWSKIGTLDDVRALDKNLLYDTSPTDDNFIPMRTGLSQAEIEDAQYWKQFYEGVMIVTGETGGGKGVFIHMLGKKHSHYFNKLIVTDTKPREAFGENIPFSFPMLIEQLERLEEIEKGIPRPYVIPSLMPGDFEDRDDWKEYRDGSIEFKCGELQSRGLIPMAAVFKEYDYNRKQFIYIPSFKPYIDHKTGKWVSSRGEVFIRNSIILLDEAGAKYIPKSKPMLSEAQIILNLCNFKRHLRSLIVCVSVDLDDFNPKLFEKTTWHAHCTQLDNKLYAYDGYPDDLVFRVNIETVKYNPLMGSLEKSIGKGDSLIINASTPRFMLGGLAWKDIFNTRNSQGMYIPARLKRRQ